MSTVGMVGLGIMGSAMAGHLLEGGWEVHGTDPDAERLADFVGRGGTDAGSASGVASKVEVLVTSLPSADALRAVTEELVASDVRVVVVETSTLPREVKESCRDALQEVGIVLLDCPLSGTGAQALERDLVVLGSGDEAAFELARPALEVVARSVRHLGAFGHGTTMKLVANLLVAVHNASTAEAFALGVRAGLDPQQLYDTVREGAGGSVIFDRRGPLMVERRYLPATARVSMFVKDVDLVQQLAADVGIRTPVLDATLPLYVAAMDAGLGDADAAAILEVLDPEVTA